MPNCHHTCWTLFARRTALSDIVLQVLSFVAENERTNIRQRQAEGIAEAKARGVKFGRPQLPVPSNFYEVHKEWREKKISLKEVPPESDLGRSISLSI